MKNHILFSNRNWKHELRVEIERQNELREDAIASELNRASAAENSLQSKIEQEKNRAIIAENVLHEEIIAESASSADAFDKVQSQFEKHLLDAQSTKKEILANIAAENTRATLAEENLQSKIETAKAHAESIGEELQNSIVAEQQRATLADSKLDSRKADKDGFYPKMTSGFSGNLVGRGEATVTEFIHHTSGGSISIEDGVARIVKIKGNTIVWNQLAQIKSGLSNNMVLFTNNGDGSYNVVTDLDAKSSANTYFEIANVENCEGEKLLIFGAPATATSASYCLKTDDGHTICGNGAIVTSTMAYNRVYIFVAKEVAINSIVVFKPQVFNLTRMFGPGNEPATIAEFRKLFPEKYYSYNDGEMQSFIAEAIETTGFNQWDEEWALGVITNGVDKASNRNILSKNYIPIVQGYDYYLKAPYGIYLACYDKEKKFIGNYTKNDSAGWVHPNTIIVSSKLQPGTCFVRFHVTTSYGAIYKNDICINISHSGYRNGEYKKYEKFVRTLPIAQYFPDGMRSAGNVRDELTAHEATTRVGVRAYAAGDENDSAVTTDGTKSCYALPEPMVVRIDEPLNLDYEVCDFGTEKIIGNNVPVKADIVYGFNAVDVIRNNSLNVDEFTGALENTFADTLTGCVKKLKKAFDFSNIAVMAAPPTAAPASDGLYIDAINLKLYIAAGGMWFTMNLDEYQI